MAPRRPLSAMLALDTFVDSVVMKDTEFEFSGFFFLILHKITNMNSP